MDKIEKFYLKNEKKILRAIQHDDLTGWCIECGKRVYTDMDAEKDTCPKCKKPAVYGAEMLLFCGV